MSLQFVIQQTGRDNFLVAVPSTATIRDVKHQVAERYGQGSSAFRLFSAATGAEMVDEQWVSKIPNLSTFRLEDSTTGGMHTHATVASGPPISALAGRAVTPTRDGPRGAACLGGGAVGDECPICLEGFAPAYPLLPLVCHHAFHEPCIREWGKTSAYCPLCRARIQMAEPAVARISTAPASMDSVQATPTVTVTHISAPLVTVRFAGEPPSLESVKATLVETRSRVMASDEYKRIVRAWTDFKESESAKRVGRAALAAAVSVVSMGGALVKDATASVMSSYPVTRSIAGMLGLPTKPLVSPTTTTTTIVVSGGSGVSPSTGASHASPGGGASMPAPSYASEPQYTPQYTPPGMDSYLVRCPTCNQVLAAPPGAPLFRCVCGTTLSR